MEKLKNLQQPTDDLSSFTLGLKNTVIDDDKYTFLLAQVMKNCRSAALERFMDEINAAIEIRNSLQELREEGGKDVPLECVIETLGGTEEFRSSPAYMNLRDSFEASHVKLSNYALVMPLYGNTLKEVLEKGIESSRVRESKGTKEELDERSKDIEEGLKQISEEKKYELSGYDILKSMKFNDRIATIVPYLIKIATGLNVLYAAKLSHLDLKPANIFVKKTRGFEVVIGDLGFLKSEKEAEGTKMSSVQDYLPLGTRHYRSPEQKDYFDICNVEIRQDTDDSENIYSLVVRDPKFRDTIIEEKDYLVFSKDAARVKYKIEQIIKNNDDSTVIKLRTKTDYKGLKPEKQTQIILYKRQGIRTDLFGLGALAFDMLTCGASPERFYDNIRADDVEGKDIASLMQTYTAVSNFQSSEPRLVHAFAPLKHQNFPNYAPPDIVELILKCLLYKAQQSFYKTNKDSGQEKNNSNRRIMEAVLDDLLKLGNKYQSRYDDNPLKTGVFTESKETSSSTLSQEIKNLQNYPIEKLPLRLAQGIWYFKKLVDFVKETIKEPEIFFSELLPEYITINPSDRNNVMNLRYILYQKDADYRNDLKNNSVYTKIVRDITNPYVPDYITFLRRSISLEKTPQANSFRYTFNDSSSQGNQVLVGDWIIINSQLRRIATVSNYEITLKDEEGNQATDLPTTNDNFASYIYYKNLDPCTYYLSMLGIYLYQIFFVGLGDATVDKPLIVNIAKSRLYMTKSGSEDVKIKDFSINKQNAERIIDTIFQVIARMYVKLTFFEDKNSFYKKKENDKERLNAVAAEVQKLQEMIENFVEVELVTLNDLADDKDFDKKMESLRSKKKIFDCLPQNLEFNELINCFLSIELPKKSFFQKLIM